MHSDTLIYDHQSFPLCCSWLHCEHAEHMFVCMDMMGMGTSWSRHPGVIRNNDIVHKYYVIKLDGYHYRQLDYMYMY